MKYIEHSMPDIGPDERRAIVGVINSNYIAEGGEVRSFEGELSALIGSVGGVATGTGTEALHLALLALGVGRGDGVIVPSYVCRSVLNAILYCGARAQLCDVNEHDFNISFSSARKRLTLKTKAVVVPHLFGCPAEIADFKKIGVPIIEDCAHSIGAKYRGRPVGSIGDLAIFSFEGTKYIVTGQGGMVTSNSRELLSRLRALKEPDAPDFPTKFTYRMTDMQAAVGRVQLARLQSFIKKRQAIARHYYRAFLSSNLGLPQAPAGGEHIYQRFMVEVKCNAVAFMESCYRQGVKVKQPIKPLPLHGYLGLPDKDFPVTAKIMRSMVSIPIYPRLSEKQRKRVINVVLGSL